MGETVVRDAVGTPDPVVERRTRRLAAPIALQILAMVGIAALLYPTAANWFSAIGHGTRIAAYVESVDALSTRERETALELADEYNAHLPQGVLRDPYLDQGRVFDEEAYRAYDAYLRVNDSSVIGTLRYPRLGIGLPIYHGTEDATLGIGIGHLYGSSLPVGGPSTHSVLTSHSGLSQSRLFTPLHGAEPGDLFQIEVLGETLYYEVTGIETVKPEDVDSLRIVEGEDQVTLFTCTPVGVNSHRLLVHGVRVEAPPYEEHDAFAGEVAGAGFPWWVIGFGLGSAATAYVLFAPPRKRRAAAARAGALEADIKEGKQ